MKKLIIAIIVNIIGITARAEEINIVGCRGSFPNALNRQEILSVYNRAELKIRTELNVKLRRTYLKIRSCRWNSDYRVMYAGKSFSPLLSYISKKLQKRHRLNLIIAPGITAGERVGMGGVASDVCTESEWNAAIAAIPRYNSSGFDGLVYGPLAVAHEVGHLLGADHIETPCNAMHPDPLREQERCGLTRFLNKSYQEVRECRSYRRTL